MADRWGSRYPHRVQPAVFLDRDNTLIANDGDLGDPAQVRLIDGVASALLKLRDVGYRLVVVSNQGGVARGKFSEAEVDAVNERIATLIDESAKCRGLIERFYYCPYHPEGANKRYRREHPWRKPQPGMLLQAGHDLGLDLGRSWLVGDQPRDVAAGHAAGCRSVMVSNDRELIEQAKPAAVVETFSEAVQHILRSGDSDRENLQPSPPSSNPAAASAAGESPTAVRKTPAAPIESGFSELRRAMLDLTDQLRSDRLRRLELTTLRMVAGVGQLLVLLLALFGLLQLDDMEAFVKWMLGAALLQLVTITLLLVDLRS